MGFQKSSFLSHPCLLNHGTSSHPECPERLESVLKAMSESPYHNLMDLTVSRLAKKEELIKVHGNAYINTILALEGQEVPLDHETLLSPGSVKAALSAAGLGLELVENLLEGKIQNGFALLRPPGHHARPNLAMGFCIFNNIAIAARKALSMGIKRILILDWDVHHGNGTQETFYEDSEVLFIDLHQENLFPQHSGLLHETGKGKGAGYTVNIPLPPSCKDDDYLYVFDTLIKPLVLRYQPELILVSAGFDAHESDPLGFMCLSTQAYGNLTAKINHLAQEVCGGKILFFLEGGYNPYFLAQNVLECTKSLVEETSPPQPDSNLISDSITTRVQEIHEIHFK